MLKSFTFFIGTRYILAKKDNRFISFTSLISMAGLTLGVLSLIIVLAVFNGSQGEMRDRTLITVPHGDIASDGPMQNWQQVSESLLGQPGITGVSPYISGEAMISDRGYHQVSAVKGIIPAGEIAVSSLEQSMVAGSLNNLTPESHGIVVGRSLAANLRLNYGDSVNLVVPEVSPGSNNFSLQTHRFTVVGIFDVRFDIGSNLALVHLQDSLTLFGLDSIGTAVQLRLKVDDIDRAGDIVENSLGLLAREFPGQRFTGEDWSISEASLFNALKMEKIVTSFMLFLIVAIGAFNIVSTLVMVVSEKQADIAILRTMGAGQYSIMGVFMVQGVIVGVLGTLLGAGLGLLLALNLNGLLTGLEQTLMPDSVYLISSLPSRVQSGDVIMVCTVALLISFLATLYPAWRASRIQPAEVLRYE